MYKLMALTAAAALSLAACGGNSYNSSSSSTSKSSSTTTSAGKSYGSGYGSASSSGSGSATTVGMYDNYFQPKTITGKAGSTVKVTLENKGQAKHNFKIDSQKSANADLDPGKTATVSVMIPASGSVQFYCEYHKTIGMTGTVKPA
jgi:plastocyanin